MWKKQLKESTNTEEQEWLNKQISTNFFQNFFPSTKNEKTSLKESKEQENSPERIILKKIVVDQKQPEDVKELQEKIKMWKKQRKESTDKEEQEELDNKIFEAVEKSTK